MVSIKNILFLFAILVSSTVTLARGPPSNDSSSNEVGPPQRNRNDSSEEQSAPWSAPGRFDHFPRAPKNDSSEFPGAGFFARNNTRQKRSIDLHVIRCNFASEGGSQCTGCNTVRRCYPFGWGIDSTCFGFFQYCNNGQCSRTKGSMCSDTTSTTLSSIATDSSSDTDYTTATDSSRTTVSSIGTDSSSDTDSTTATGYFTTTFSSIATDSSSDTDYTTATDSSSDTDYTTATDSSSDTDYTTATDSFSTTFSSIASSS